MNKLLTVLSCTVILSAQTEISRKHYLDERGPLTGLSPLAPRLVGDRFLRQAAADFQLSPADLEGVYVWKEYKTAHNGVTHLIYRQQYRGLDVYNTEWVINVDREGRVLNAGGMLSQAPGSAVAEPSWDAAPRSARAAVAAVNPKVGERDSAKEIEGTRAGNRVLFPRGELGAEVEGRPVWHRANGVLRPAWIFQVTDEDGISRFEVAVDEGTGIALSKRSLTMFQSAPRGYVFAGQSPYPNPNPGVRLNARPALVDRVLVPFSGASAASPRGWVSDAETRGNNTVAGTNPLGLVYSDPVTAKLTNGLFQFPLLLGPDAPNPFSFADAASTNLFYWMNRAHDLFYEIGFDEAAGNFQSDNFGRGGQGGDAMLAYAHFGTALGTRAALNNAVFFSRSDADGTPGAVAMFLATFGGTFGDGSYDAEVIVHEYTHGVTTRLLRGYTTYQAAAMGEAWSDFYSLEFTIPEGAPPDGSYPQGEYLSQNFGLGIRTRPYSTNMDINPLTFANLGRLELFPEVHSDGEIWVEALWEARASLIRQFGEREGRRRARILVLDGLKLSPPEPSYVDMRDAILLADRVDFNGASQKELWDAFARRGLGVLAQSSSGNTAHVSASFERPSDTAAIRFYEPSYTIGEWVRVALHDANNSQASARVRVTGSSGDAETISLRKSGSVFLGTLPTTPIPVNLENGALSLLPGDTITAVHVDSDAGGAPREVLITSPVTPSYALALSAPSFQFSNETPLNFRASTGTFRRYDLPFAFPFFGRSYTSLRMFANGLLFFDLPAPTACTDLSVFSQFSAIAPMWRQMTTAGFAQPNENVYVSQTADSITFRWAGETASSSGSGEPLNFAATLFRDGRIQFNYGSGNRNVASVSGLTGCGYASPVVGISPGTETFNQISSAHMLAANLDSVPSVTFFPPFNASSAPTGVLETPAPGDTAQGILSGRGVVFDTSAPVVRVDVLIDGVWRAVAARGVPRPDYCAQQAVPGCPAIGFTFNLNLESLNLTPGKHTARLRATNAYGAFTDFPEEAVPFEVIPGQDRLPTGVIESPADGAEVSALATVRGWVAAGDLRVTAVDVLVDGITYGRASYGITRPDVCDGLSPRPVNCPGVGFVFGLLSTGGTIPLSNGEHTLQIRAQDETGRLTLLPSTPQRLVVTNRENRLPAGVLVSPTPSERMKGDIAIYGHAWDPDGRIIAVQLLWNGEVRATIPYGRPRPSECQALADVPACPNIGFEMGFDTRGLPNGPNVLGVRLIDDRGASVIVPNAVRDGINVFIEN